MQGYSHSFFVEHVIGDSGGPIFKVDHVAGNLLKGYAKMDLIYGVTSYGPNCSSVRNGGVYTSTISFARWIDDILVNGKVRVLTLSLIEHFSDSLAFFLFWLLVKVIRPNLGSRSYMGIVMDYMMILII